MNKWIGISLGTLFGISHIAMIGLLSKKSSVPMISPPVGPYTSYMIEAGKEGYKISYRANDPKTMYKTTKLKEKGGFLGLANENKEVIEEYTMNGDAHITKQHQVSGSTTSDKSEACIKAIGSAEGTGRLVRNISWCSRCSYCFYYSFRGWVVAGWVAYVWW